MKKQSYSERIDIFRDLICKAEAIAFIGGDGISGTSDASRGKLETLKKDEKISGIITWNQDSISWSDVSFYGERPSEEDWRNAVDIIRSSDMLIIAGTSLSDDLTMSLLRYFTGKYAVLISKERSNADFDADIIFRNDLDEVFSKL